MIPSHIEEKNVVFIGAGNVATHLSLAMKNAGFSIRQIFSHSESNAKSLAEILNCDYTTDIKEILPDADIYLFSLKDDILPDIVAKTPLNNGLWIHTAGSVPIDIFHGYAAHFGVIYPMQTLSKQRTTDFFKVPLFIEGNTPNYEEKIYDIAQMLSGSVTRMNSDKRKYLHLAAVFACNFSNHMYSLAAQIVEEQGIDWHILQPLIDETANKLYSMSPEDAQTGPAVRYDRNVIERHLSMLKEEDMRKLYLMISENIHVRHITHKK